MKSLEGPGMGRQGNEGTKAEGMSERRYPKRESHFAHRFVRVLQKSCAAQDIGRDAVLLLCFISHTEDAARYSGPVRFWNSQLEQTMGYTSPKQLNNARRKAVESGWLHYDRSGPRDVGEYFVIIPDRFKTIPDGPIEEPILSLNGKNKKQDGDAILSELGMNGGKDSGKDPGKNSGKPSNPSPNPNPSPNTGATSSQTDLVASQSISPPAPPALPAQLEPPLPPAPAEKEIRPEDVPLPDCLNVPEFLAARDAWFKQRRRKRISLRPEFVQGQYAKLAPLGPVQAAACLEYTVTQDYSGVFPEKFANGRSPANTRSQPSRVGPGQRYAEPG